METVTEAHHGQQRQLWLTEAACLDGHSKAGSCCPYACPPACLPAFLPSHPRAHWAACPCCLAPQLTRTVEWCISRMCTRLGPLSGLLWSMPTALSGETLPSKCMSVPSPNALFLAWAASSPDAAQPALSAQPWALRFLGRMCTKGSATPEPSTSIAAASS